MEDGDINSYTDTGKRRISIFLYIEYYILYIVFLLEKEEQCRV